MDALRQVERASGQPQGLPLQGLNDAEAKVIQDSIDAEGMRVMHVMSPGPLEGHWILSAPYVRDGEQRLYVDELKLHHLIVRWPAREPIRGFLRGVETVEWPMMLWALRKGERVSEQIKVAAEAYFETFAQWPEFAWMRRLPSGVENGQVVDLEHTEIMLFEAEWVPGYGPGTHPDGRGNIRMLCVGNGRGNLRF